MSIIRGTLLFKSTVFPCLNFAYSFAEDSIMMEFMSGENILKAKKLCLASGETTGCHCYGSQTCHPSLFYLEVDTLPTNISEN